MAVKKHLPWYITYVGRVSSLNKHHLVHNHSHFSYSYMPYGIRCKIFERVITLNLLVCTVCRIVTFNFNVCIIQYISLHACMHACS